MGLVQLELTAVVQREIDGIEMGVLADGTPYLTARGLAKLCGRAPSGIITLGANWQEEQRKPRGRAIARALAEHGYTEPELFVKIRSNGKLEHAHTDAVCMAILEYYAFEVDGDKRQALAAYRFLARQSLRLFIYARVGYDPQKLIPDAWKHFHDRMMTNGSYPAGYFSVFREIADIIVALIHEGMTVDHHVVPDISVGKLWSSHWQDANLTAEHGQRMKFPHVYPDYFPQKSEVEVWVYPLTALGEFRIWMQQEYLPQKFPEYLIRKAKRGALPLSHVELIVAAVTGTPVLPELPE